MFGQTKSKKSDRDNGLKQLGHEYVSPRTICMASHSDCSSNITELIEENVLEYYLNCFQNMINFNIFETTRQKWIHKIIKL